ncbi:MAG: NAD(P)H-dependent oxidoreductase [Alphaproteobacteria bacterium]|nr:NAD(P)H-dependent oxidoreductase [Alphaproteobacteria bacterium]
MSGASAPYIVGLGGTTRPGSSSERALERALATARSLGARTDLFGGAYLARLPHYDPHATASGEARRDFIAAIRRADGVIIATPGYHGSISGLVKNALDCLEDLREDARPYLDGRAVACIVAASGAQAAVSTLAALRSIVHALRGWPTPMGATLAAPRLFNADGAFCDDRDAWQVDLTARQVVAFAQCGLGAGLTASDPSTTPR